MTKRYGVWLDGFLVPESCPVVSGMLYVTSAKDASDLFALLQGELRRHLPTDGTAIRQLALLAVRHATLHPSRVTVLAPAEIDVPNIMQALADCIGVPTFTVPLGLSAGHGWQGSGLHEWLRDTAMASFGDKSIVTITDLEVLRAPRGRYARLSASSERATDDLARAAAQVLAGRPVPSDSSNAPAIPTERMSVAITGEVQDLALNPTPGDWIDWGVSPRIARELAATQVVRLAPLVGDDLALSLLDGLDDLYATYKAVGYKLDIDPATLQYAATALGRGDYGGGSAAAAWLRHAATDGLIRLLEGAAPVDTRYTITPDALHIPEPPPGHWSD